MRRFLVAAVAMMMGGVAAGQGFDPRQHRDFAGAATQVMVLGTPHLSNMPKAFTAASLKPVLDRLATYRPDIVTIEALSGPQCAGIIRYKARYPGVADRYCWDPAPAAKATGLDMVAATEAIDTALESWPKAPTAAQRRHLAASFLAGGDRASAVVQWLRLPAAERKAGDGLDDTLVALLVKSMARPDESYSIAAALAARLGLERVYPVDDHTSDAVVATLPKAFETTMTEIWSAAAARQSELNAIEAKLGTPQATLDMYRYHNDPGIAQTIFDSDFGAALKHRSPELYGRQYVGWWEVRNLRMVANIRAAAANRPGGRVLVVVGASHKPFFDSYLDMMHDVKVVDAMAVLR
jgi:hypothetical protein